MGFATTAQIPQRGIEHWAPPVVDYLYQLVGDAQAIESLAESVLSHGALSDLSLNSEQAFLKVLADATDAACNFLLPRSESERLPPLQYAAADRETPERMAADSIVRAGRRLPVLKRAALALADLLGLTTPQVAAVLRQPVDHTERFIAGARRDFARELNEICRMRGQVPLADIAPALALGLRPRQGYAESAFAFAPFFALPDERMALLKWTAVRNGEHPVPVAASRPRRSLTRAELAAAFLVLLSLAAGWIAFAAWSSSGLTSPLWPLGATPTTQVASRLPSPTVRASPPVVAPPTATPTATTVVVPRATATATSTATPTPTATPTATMVPEPTDTATPVPPTSTPRPTRRIIPWVPTATPTRVYYVPTATRVYYAPTATRVYYAPTPTRTPTRVPPTATFAPHTPTPTVFHPTITPAP
jgi:DNA-directed RNA polymerase specialized sigma24 family protein